MNENPAGRVSKTLSLRPLAAHFDQLPDGAMVPIKVLAAVTNEGISTHWAKAKRDPNHPQPIRLSAKCTRFRVGDIRAYLAGQDAAFTETVVEAIRKVECDDTAAVRNAPLKVTEGSL